MSDIEIAQSVTPKPIEEIAAGLDLSGDDLELYGKYKAKISLPAVRRMAGRPDGKLILVTAITPTSAGEGKTTTTVGLGDALRVWAKKRYWPCGNPLWACLWDQRRRRRRRMGAGHPHGGYQSSFHRRHARHRGGQ